MRKAVCRCGEGGSITVTGSGWGRVFRQGDVVDLDAPVADGAELTWGTAIGADRELFDDLIPALLEPDVEE